MKARKLLLWTLGSLGAVLLAAQAIRPERNLGPETPGPDDLRTLHPLPPAVLARLETACFDCHSNRTRYPWYASVQPLAWWLDQHVRDGKRELNFSSWGTYSQRRQTSQLDAIVDAITDKTMPLPSYTWAHRDAILSKADADLLIDWAETLRDEIEDGK